MRVIRVMLIVAALLVAGAAGRALWEPASLTIAEHELVLPRWPQACDGLRVAVLADLHVGSPFNGMDNLRRVVEKTREARPDLVLLAGDYVIHGVVGGQFVAPETAAVELAGLRQTADTYAVLGNHDWWLDAPRVRRALESVSIPVLEDDAVRVQRGACGLWLAGIGDYWEGAHDVTRALAAVPARAPTIALTHNPDVFVDVPQRVALTIAGHTHGGQVYVPGIGRPVVPSEYGERFAFGHVVEGDRHLFVSPGIGTSILPVRFLVQPEITLLVLRAAPGLERAASEQGNKTNPENGESTR